MKRLVTVDKSDMHAFCFSGAILGGVVMIRVDDGNTVVSNHGEVFKLSAGEWDMFVEVKRKR